MDQESRRFELVQQSTAGDGDALQQLIVYYHGPLYGKIAARLEGPLCRHLDPDDILQQAYVRAFQDIQTNRFDSPGRFYRWLERVTLDRLRNASRDLGRKKRDIHRDVNASAQGPTSSSPCLLERLSAHGLTPSRQLAKHEASAVVLSSLARLTEDQRAVIRMRFLEDRPVREIPDEMEKTEAAVYMLCSRGLEALQKLLGSMTQYLSRK